MRYFLENNEFETLGKVKKEAIKLAKQRNEDVCFTSLSSSYKQNWYTACPDGKIIKKLKTMNLTNYVQQHSARKAARKLIDKALARFIPMGLDDLPDTADLCSIVDELEDIIIANDADMKSQIRQLLDDSINEDTIEELIMS